MQETQDQIYKADPAEKIEIMLSNFEFCLSLRVHFCYNFKDMYLKVGFMLRYKCNVLLLTFYLIEFVVLNSA